jgi:UDP-galactopyranose mutase
MSSKELIAREDLVCFSHLRWSFVFQRPQHIMSRFAAGRRVFFIEEPLFEEIDTPTMRLRTCSKTGVRVATPLLPARLHPDSARKAVAQMVRELFRRQEIQDYIAWFYTPMALELAPKLEPKATIYDCMDELSLFRHAPPDISLRERKLMNRCDLVFTGGYSLFEAKRHLHKNIHPFPSSVDCGHFGQARTLTDSAEDQKKIGHPRIGYAGVIDERIDLDLIRNVAERRPDWQIVMIGPVVKIDPSSLPQRANIHWLGMKDYDELPKYFAGWDVAMMPFALNDSTRFISPTKTPEYLAAGLPVISTPIRDVVRQYGHLGLVEISRDAEEFLAGIEHLLIREHGMKWHERADAFLRTLSWDKTWSSMNQLIEDVLSSRTPEKAIAASALTLSPGAASV